MADFIVVHNGPQGSADGSTVANGMALQTALDTVTAGNRILVCATGEYVFAVQVDVDTQVGTTLLPITVTGASATGVVNGTRPTINRQGVLGFVCSATSTNYIFRNLNGIGAGSNGRVMFNTSPGCVIEDCGNVYTGTGGGFISSSSSGAVIRRCVTTGGSGQTGFNIGRGIVSDCLAIGCATGFASSSAATGVIFNKCIAYSCGGQGFYTGTSSGGGITLTDCLAFGCGIGLNVLNNVLGLMVKRCTFSDCTTGVTLAAAVNAFAGIMFEDCIVAHNSGYGIANHANLLEGYAPLITRTAFYNNTTGNLQYGAIDASCTTTVDPEFIDHVNATLTSRDYGLAKTSGLIQRPFTDMMSRVTYSDWGAYQIADLTPAEIAAAVWTATGRTLTA